MKTINERISAIKAFFVGNERGSGKKFSESLGLTLSNGRNICTPGYSLGLKYVEKILNAYPSVDANWLITGKGEMLKKENISNVVEKGDNASFANSPLSEKYIDYQRKEEEFSKREDSYLASIGNLSANIRSLRQEIEILKGQLKEKDDLIEKLYTSFQVFDENAGVSQKHA